MHGLVDFLDDIEDADRFGDQRRYIEVLLEALKPAQERLRLHPVLPPGVEHDLDGHGTAHAFIHKVVGLPQREGLRAVSYTHLDVYKRQRPPRPDPR